jgi:hypothetical protein
MATSTYDDYDVISTYELTDVSVLAKGTLKAPFNIFNQTTLRNIILNPQKIDDTVVQDYLSQDIRLIPNYPRYLGDGNTYTFGEVTGRSSWRRGSSSG